MSASNFRVGRHAGLLLPLFSAPGRESWGIGEIGDLPVFAGWLRAAGLDFLQVLPLNEMASGQHSPYSAISAMAQDPIFLSVRHLPEFQSAGGESSLSDEQRRQLAAVRDGGRIDYPTVRTLKMAVLDTAFDRFLEQEWRSNTRRAEELNQYMASQSWWLEEYVLFRALRERHQEKPWWEWEQGLADRDPLVLARARNVLEKECLFYAWLQWLADIQWREARLAAEPVGVFGDMPFMVGRDSADVWSRQHAFRLDGSVGAPPDAFSETGQDWGFPAYRWDVFVSEDDEWIRARSRRYAAIFDGYRVDHLVGFYRTYIIGDDNERHFSPEGEPAQLAQGTRVMRIFLESDARIIAEDLGTVPDFVRESLSRLGIAGYKVLRWEREWEEPAMPFRNPLEYPAVSVATTGTHDTETLAEWWESAPLDERQLVAGIPFLKARSIDVETPECMPATRDALLELLVASSSELLILPIQDVFGWRDRINVPATVTDDNWTWRLPWPVEDLLEQPETVERARVLRAWTLAFERSAVLSGSIEDEPPAVAAR